MEITYLASTMKDDKIFNKEASDDTLEDVTIDEEPLWTYKSEMVQSINDEKTQFAMEKNSTADTSSIEPHNEFARFINIEDENIRVDNALPDAVVNESQNKQVNDGPAGSRSKKSKKKEISATTVKYKYVKKLMELHCSRCSVTSELQRSRWPADRTKCNQCQDFMLYRCKKCKRQYSSFNLYAYRHLRSNCFAESSYKCAHCDYQAKVKICLQSHIKHKHSPRPCPCCDAAFQDFEALKEHRRKSDCNGRQLKCNQCAYCCLTPTQMKLHVRSEHRSLYTCGNCGKKYRNLQWFKKHSQSSCESPLTFKCEHCEYKTNTKNRLATHLKNIIHLQEEQSD